MKLIEPTYGASIDMKTTSSFNVFAVPSAAKVFRLELIPHTIEYERWMKLLDLAGAWGTDSDYDGPGDMNGDNKADAMDLYLLASEWN